MTFSSHYGLCSMEFRTDISRLAIVGNRGEIKVFH